MRLMGGLRKKMPITAITFFIGCVAISGIPPLAGFWSKDEILGQAFNTYPVLWAVGFLTAGMTAFYMFRLYFLTFEGEFRGNDSAMQHALMEAAGKSIDEMSKRDGRGSDSEKSVIKGNGEACDDPGLKSHELQGSIVHTCGIGSRCIWADAEGDDPEECAACKLAQEALVAARHKAEHIAGGVNSVEVEQFNLSENDTDYVRVEQEFVPEYVFADDMF